MALRGRPHVIQLRSIFSPLTLALVLYAPLLLLYAASGSDIFADEFGARKTLSWTGFAYFALALVCFMAAAKVGQDTAPPSKLQRQSTRYELTPATRRSLAVLLEVALVLSVVAYVTWFTRGIVRAGGITELFDIWRSNPHRVKEEILTTLPGVTTLTQLAVAAIPLAIAFKLVRRGSVIRALVVLVFVLATLRAVLYNERLALIELVVPVVFLIAAPRRVTLPRVVVYALVFVIAAVTFFGVTELRRTYAYTDDVTASRATTRFFGYYLTSLNNGMAVVDEYPAQTPFYSSGQFFWQFPGVGDLRAEHFPGVGTLSFRYADAFDVDPESFWPQAFVDQGLDYEFNVFTGPGYLAADFGWAALIVVFVLGVVSGRLYRGSETSPLHRALYAVWLVGLLEFMRILYFTDTRMFPAYLVFLGAYLVLRDAQRTPGAVRSPPRSTTAVAQSS
jgi:oligosaccharide repeat unit polymerase